MTVVLALLGSFAAMFALNFSLDNISLMGLTIAVGFVVVDAIVVVENIYRHVEDSMTPFEAALKGSGEIAFTVVSISVSLVAVFIPILLMGGARCCARASCGRKPVPRMGGSIAASRPASTPMLAGYRRTLDVALRHRAIMLGVFLSTVAITVVIAIQIPKGFFPIQDTGASPRCPRRLRLTR